MAQSLAIIILVGLIANKIFEKLNLPGLLGMLIVGGIIGPYGLDILNKEMIGISPDLRKIALIIILIRAGLGINKDDLKKVGSTTLKMSFLPGVVEGFFIMLVSVRFLGFSIAQGGMLGFIIAAVSPAVVVPAMLTLMENKIGTKKNIPTLILAAASIDDVFAITIFSAFLGLYSGENINIGRQLLNIPTSIMLGVILGFGISILMVKVFKKYSIKDTKKVLIILSLGILLTQLENILKDKVAIASLLGVMAIGFIITEKMPSLGIKLAKAFNHIWVLAEILLFVLVGAQVDTSVAVNAGVVGSIIILIGLIGRSIGVIMSTLGTDMNYKERLFCIISYIPKATVQAAMGAVPLSLGVKDGDIILAISVLSILITAPLGAIGIKFFSKKLLQKEVA